MIRAGFLSIDLTGSVGMSMSGYSERFKGNEGVHDPVEQKLMLLEIDGEYLALTSGDYIGVTSLTTKLVREALNQKLGIPNENVVLCATHTHSSYAAVRVDEPGRLEGIIMDPEISEVDKAYYTLFVNKIIGGFEYLYNNLEEVELGYGIGSLNGLGANRNDKDGFFDNSVHVLKATNKNGKVVGVITEFACHPTILNFENYLISADYPGCFRRTVEKVYPDCVVMFVQGCAGEISTRFTRRGQDFEEIQRMGNLLAGEVIKLLSTIKSTDNFKIESKSQPVRFYRKDFGSDEELEKNYKENLELLEKLKAENAPKEVIRKQYVSLQGFDRTRRFKKSCNFEYIDSIVQVTKLGEFTFVGIPGEPFGEIGRDIKAITGENTMIAGYCNDHTGYLVSREGLAGKGYEKEMMLFDENTHQAIVDAAKLAFKNE